MRRIQAETQDGPRRVGKDFFTAASHSLRLAGCILRTFRYSRTAHRRMSFTNGLSRGS